MSMNFIIKGFPLLNERTSEDERTLLELFHWDLSELSRKYPMASFVWKENGKVSCPQQPMPILDKHPMYSESYGDE